ncbi:MAG TPA: SpoIIE family protein phosphatase [bacterium]|nr:SpoIIE family protein phosphatase [bacterium]
MEAPEPIILLVDDDPLCRRLYTGVLEENGYKPVTLSDGLEGVEFCRRKRPDLIVSDWVMKDLNGPEFLEHVRKNRDLLDVYFIMLTGRTGVERIVEVLDKGADDFISKPVDQRELLARVRTGLRVVRLQKELKEANREQAKLLVERERALNALAQELAQASEYVQSLLPHPLQGEIHTDWQYIPCAQLGGDALGYHWIDPDHFAIYLLDVSGHGVGAALLSVSVIDTLRLRTLPNTDFLDPVSVLNSLNMTFSMSEHDDQFFTIWYGVYEKSTGNLVYGGGGHPPAILVRGNTGATPSSLDLTSDGRIVGAFSDTVFRSHSCRIEPGDSLYVYSDGVLDSVLVGGKAVCLREFQDFLMQQEPLRKNNTERILCKIRENQGSEFFEDDYSMLQVVFSR